MDFVTALNVTIYGLGIVFLALLVVMFAIMVLSRVFAVATGKDFLAVQAPVEEPAPEIPVAPASSPSVGVPVAPAPTTAPSAKSSPVSPKAPAAASSPVRAPAAPVMRPLAADCRKVTAPLPGHVLSIAVKPGDTVHKGQELCVIEAMKMANSIKAQRDCTVREVLISAGDNVPFGTPLFAID